MPKLTKFKKSLPGAILAEHYYRLPPDERTTLRNKILIGCKIADKTFYSWLQKSVPAYAYQIINEASGEPLY